MASTVQRGKSMEEESMIPTRSAQGISENELDAISPEQEIKILSEKLGDRDSTISTFAKSSQALERELAGAKLEIKALRDKIQGKTTESDLDVNIGQMASDLEYYKNAEERLSEEVYRLRKLMKFQQNNSNTSEDDISLTGSTASSFYPHSQLLQERDRAISRLVKQSMEFEATIRRLKEELSTVKRELEGYREEEQGLRQGPTSAEIVQLRRETELYAEQVVEQDEEIEQLRSVVRSREERIAALEKELTGAKMRSMDKTQSKSIQDLEAEIDELKESNEHQREELRDLRQKAREYQKATDEIALAKIEAHEAKEETESLREQLDKVKQEKSKLAKLLDEETMEMDRLEKDSRELEGARKQIKGLEHQIAEQQSIIDELEAAQALVPKSTSEADEMVIQSLTEEKESMQHKLQTQTATINEAKRTIIELEQMLAKKQSEETSAFEMERDELVSEIESLTEQLESSRLVLKKFEEERDIIEDFKQKLEQADEDREATEKQIVDTYERKLSLLKLDKDVTIDKLRKELTETKEQTSSKLEHASIAVKKYEAEILELKEEMTAQLLQRETRIHALEQTLEAQQQLVNNMKAEMDHLQGSMQSSVAGRREEIDDMQQELVDLTATSVKQEREISALHMQLDEQKLAHEAEVQKLKETIESLENQHDHNNHRTDNDVQLELRIKEIKDRLEKLKWRNSSLQEENQELRERLEKTETKLQTNGESERVIYLEKQTSKLQQDLDAEKARVRQLEAELLEATQPNVKPPIPPQEITTKKSTGASTPRRLGFLGRKRTTSADVGLSQEEDD